MDDVVSYIAESRAAFFEQLRILIRFKSVSTDAGFSGDVAACARHLMGLFEEIGMQRTELVETTKHPVVISSYEVSPDLPTVLIYGHYDVQPADPYDLWDSDPFEAVVRDGYVFGRGVSDDKGQFLCHVLAVKSLLAVRGTLPVNVTFIIEGEEEIGSPNLEAVLRSHREALKADVAVVSDSPMLDVNQPALCVSLRGMVYAEIHVKGPCKDLHSGQYGGFVVNPVQALARIIAGLKDEGDRVCVPGFYDNVDIPTDEEQAALREVMAVTTMTPAAYKVDLKVGEFSCEDDLIWEKMWFEPTLDCNGIEGGYVEEGAKTIIPSQASAKVSMRLVASQDPVKIASLFTDYVQKLAPRGVTIDVQIHTLAHPAKMQRNTRFMEAASFAFEHGFGRKPLFVGEGGTIPVIAQFKDVLGLDTVMMGFNCPDDGIHSPNERFLEASFYKGIETSVFFLSKLGNKGG